MSRRKRLPRGVVIAALYLAGVLTVTIATTVWGDRWWLATVALFGPRWIWATPLVLLVPLCALFERRLVSFALLAATCPLLLYLNDFHVSPQAFRSAVEAPVLRVMTYNVGGGSISNDALADELVVLGIDAAGFPECANIDKGKLIARGYTVRVDSGLCFATRLPLKKVDVRDPKDFWAINGSGAIDRYELEWSGRPFSVELVHLETVREGLSEAIEFRVWKNDWKGPEVLSANIAERGEESRAAVQWAHRATVPSIVMGDFNMPVDSAIYRTYWSSFHNALSERTLGRTVTKDTRWFGIRIDHVVHDDGLECRKAWVGRSLGGDHRPVIAELAWSAR